MATEEIKVINEWRKEFTRSFSKTEIKQLEKLSGAVVQNIIDDTMPGGPRECPIKTPAKPHLTAVTGKKIMTLYGQNLNVV